MRVFLNIKIFLVSLTCRINLAKLGGVNFNCDVIFLCSFLFLFRSRTFSVSFQSNIIDIAVACSIHYFEKSIYRKIPKSNGPPENNSSPKELSYSMVPPRDSRFRFGFSAML